MLKFLNTILVHPLFNILIFFVWLVPDHNIGWAIIILTVIVRLALLPSSMNATRAQKKMRDLQPELAQLQAKYKDDKQKLAQAQMDFYKENKVNPLGSCLPLLIQLPILIAMYYAFQLALKPDSFNFLYGFVPEPPFIKTAFLGLDLAQKDRYILPIIAGVLQFIQSRQLMPLNPPKTDKTKGPDMQTMMSKQMLYIMPIFTIYIAGQLPAALPLYWIITNIFTIVQQWFVFREKTPPAVLNKERKELEEYIAHDPLLQEKPKVTKKHGVEITVRKKGKK